MLNCLFHKLSLINRNSEHSCLPTQRGLWGSTPPVPVVGGGFPPGEPGCWDLSRGTRQQCVVYICLVADAAGPLSPNAKRIVIVLKKKKKSFDLKKVRLWVGARFDLKAS